MNSVGLTSFLPAGGSQGSNTFVAEGYVPPKGANMNLATPIQMQGDYMQAMGTPLLAGRLLTPADNANSQLVSIVNQKFAEHYWPGGNAIGKRFRIGMQETSDALGHHRRRSRRREGGFARRPRQGTALPDHRPI